MTDKTQIPEDVKAAAARIVGTSPNAHDERRLVIRGIMDERERCAGIAEMHDHRGDIAAAIRRRSA